MTTATIRGPQLPAYEADPLGWVAQRLRVTHMEDGPVTTEILMGEDAILLRFPSGAERVVCVDSEPHGRTSIPVTRVEMERVRQERDDADEELTAVAAERDDLESDLEGARDVIRSARALLERIEESDADLPAWLRDSATFFLTHNPVP